MNPIIFSIFFFSFLFVMKPKNVIDFDGFYFSPFSIQIYRRIEKEKSLMSFVKLLNKKFMKGMHGILMKTGKYLIKIMELVKM